MNEVRYENNRLKSRIVIINDNESIREYYYNTERNSIDHQVFLTSGKVTMGKQYYESGNIKNIMYFNDDEKLHKIDSPSLILYYENENIKLQKWHIDGNIHRDNLPAVECFNKDGKNVYFAHYSNDKLHRIDGFAEWKFNTAEHYDQYYDEENEYEDIISEYNWYNNGVKYKAEKYIDENNCFIEIFYENNVCLEEYFYKNYKVRTTWFKENKLYRDNDLPTIELYDNNKLIEKEWKYEIGYSRDNNLPAIECYDDDGNINEKNWYKNGKKHRDEGFAVEYYENNVLISGEIWKNGIREIRFEKYDGNENCSICHELHDNMILTTCRHIFCKTCMDSWMLESNDNCPYCRQKM